MECKGKGWIKPCISYSKDITKWLGKKAEAFQLNIQRHLSLTGFSRLVLKTKKPDHTSTGILVNSLEASLMNYLPTFNINWIFKLGLKTGKAGPHKHRHFSE